MADIATVVAAAVSAAGAAVSAAVAASTASRVAAINRAASLEQAEAAARRSYEFDARKRLYEAAEPVLFQLTERANDALTAILSLAEEARSGNLSPWVDPKADSYYPRSIAYALLLPSVLFTLLRRNLTAVDLRLSARLTRYYVIAKILYESWMQDYDLAKAEPPIRYIPDPSREHDAARKRSDPAADRQGIVLGFLERAVDAMIALDSRGQLYCRSFSDFDAGCSEEENPLGDVEGLVRGFHPERHRVLWRVLVLQAILCTALLDAGPTKGSDVTPVLRPFSQRACAALSWSYVDEDGAVATAEIEAVERYVRSRYGELYMAIADAETTVAAIGARATEGGSRS
ncbi:MAG TPA: hypothetical protein VFB22_01815 [Candidatus Baltobacteraceae bacterium]|nr:hypothetical protein [Candidatus Baltobacteraceae bacterium]